MMFSTGLIPFSDYALPAFAGMILICVVVENGTATAWVVYAAVALLSVFITPQREAALIFITFFGYYPILRPSLQRLPAPLRGPLKFIIFNTAIVGGYAVAIRLLGMYWLAEGLNDFGRWSLQLFIAGANLLFVTYDFALGRMYFIYRHWFRVKFLGRR